MMTVKIVLACIQVCLSLTALAFLIKALYHSHQSDRILDHKGKQTFWQWLRRIDTPRGTGIWK